MDCRRCVAAHESMFADTKRKANVGGGFRCFLHLNRIDG